MRKSILLACAVAQAAGTCETWCINSCMDLNGPTEVECGGCDESNRCRPGAEGFGRPLSQHGTGGMGHSSAPGISPQACASADRPEGCAAAEVAYDMGEVNRNGKPIAQPKEFVTDWQVGVCDLQRVHHSQLTRRMVEEAQEPFIVVGLTETWGARTGWAKAELLAKYGDEPYHLHAHGNESLRKLLEWEGKYHMGHAVYPPGGCYSDPWRPYSPMLFGALGGDYAVPKYFTPMSTFQMGVGSGDGIGVPPENHPSSWFAAVKGRKRWVLMPPEAGTSRSGGPGSEPPEVMSRMSDNLCEPKNKPKTALHCDQQEGEVIWVPDFWWHETCGLDGFSIGIGGITYSGCCEDREFDGRGGCDEFGKGYKIDDIMSCRAGDLTCGTLPVTKFYSYADHEGHSDS